MLDNANNSGEIVAAVFMYSLFLKKLYPSTNLYIVIYNKNAISTKIKAPVKNFMRGL